MSGWWVLQLVQSGGVAVLVSWIFWMIFSITLHELAHGWAALWQGDSTPRALNRMTLNPLVHMGPWSLLAFALIGIAWGAMPTDESRYRWKRRGRIVVAGAGPAMNLALAAAAVVLLIAWLALGQRSGENLYRNLAGFLWTGAWLNLALAAFNLLPVPPLDGSHILAGLSFRLYRLYQHPQAQAVGMLVILFFFLTSLGQYLFVAAALVAALFAELAGRLLGSPSITEVVPLLGG